jgi:hypothetical protein
LNRGAISNEGDDLHFSTAGGACFEIRVKEPARIDFQSLLSQHRHSQAFKPGLGWIRIALEKTPKARLTD